MLTSPLEQFELFVLKPYSFWFGGLDTSFTNATLFLFLAISLVFMLFFFGLLRPQLIPHPFQIVLEGLVTFIITIVKQQTGRYGLKYLPLFLAIFLLILSSNLIGLLPFAFTPSSQLIFTLTLAFSCNFAIILIGFYHNGLNFLQLFVPKGGPKWLLPLIVLIEVLSYLLRTLSLSIRLFANMMAGHTLLHILASFITAFLKSGHAIIAFFPLVLVVAVIVLEVGIAFLQAYVFTILLCIYLNDSFHPSH